jgi:uncharacterized protein (TIGR02453 family)
MADNVSFRPAMFTFLRELADNNDREWFAENKDRYEAQVKEPALDFINDFAPRLEKLSPHFVADSGAVGGSLFRIYRDTRFSKDKTPYKTHTGVVFKHESAKDVHAPGYYVHLQPRECFVGLGIWMPDGPTTRKIREAIAEDPAAWKKAAYGKRFTDVFSLGDGEKLKRPPRGFDPDHPYVEDLKRKSFTAGVKVSQKQVTAPGFVDDYAKMCKAGSPFMKFLCDAVGVPF